MQASTTAHNHHACLVMGRLQTGSFRLDERAKRTFQLRPNCGHASPLVYKDQCIIRPPFENSAPRCSEMLSGLIH
jgi:hypothetical protein